MTVRQSFLRAAASCPHSAWLSRQVDVMSHPMCRGLVFHAFAEKAITTLRDHAEQTLDQGHAKAILLEAINEHPEWPVPAEEMDSLRIMVFHFAEHWIQPDRAVSVEVPLGMEVAGEMVTGRVDAMWLDGDTCHIRDWKAGFGLPAQDSISNKVDGRPSGAKAFQLIVYALLAAEHLSALPGPQPTRYDCRFVYPMFATDDGLVTREAVIHKDDLVEHRAYLDALVKRVKHYEAQDDWPAVPGTHCAMCPAPKRCPIPADLRPVGSIFEEGPEWLATKLWAAEKTVKELQGELREYIKDWGPVQVGDGDEEYALKQVTSSRTNAKAKQALMDGARVDPDELFATSVATRFGKYKRETA